MINKTWTESDIICDAIGEGSLQEEADWLNEKLPDDYKITRQTLHNWVVGKYDPRDEFIRALMMFYPEDDKRFILGRTLTDKRLAKMKSIQLKVTG